MSEAASTSPGGAAACSPSGALKMKAKAKPPTSWNRRRLSHTARFFHKTGGCEKGARPRVTGVIQKSGRQSETGESLPPAGFIPSQFVLGNVLRGGRDFQPLAHPLSLRMSNALIGSELYCVPVSSQSDSLGRNEDLLANLRIYIVDTSVVVFGLLIFPNNAFPTDRRSSLHSKLSVP
jgi:hypothetical protein